MLFELLAVTGLRCNLSGKSLVLLHHVDSVFQQYHFSVNSGEAVLDLPLVGVEALPHALDGIVEVQQHT